MATDPSPDLQLTTIAGESRTVAQWLTSFHLVVVVLDPFTWESAWLIDTAGRTLEQFAPADCRVGWVVTGTADEAREFIGPWAQQLLTFADPDRELVKALGLERLPAFVHLNLAGQLDGVAEGWQPEDWRKAIENLARVLSWSKPSIPAPGDPAPYEGSPALP